MCFVPEESASEKQLKHTRDIFDMLFNFAIVILTDSYCSNKCKCKALMYDIIYCYEQDSHHNVYEYCCDCYRICKKRIMTKDNGL